MNSQETEPNVFSILNNPDKRAAFQNSFGSKARHKWGERYPSLGEEDIRGVLLDMLPLLVEADISSNISPFIEAGLRTRQRQLKNNGQASLPAPIDPTQENSPHPDSNHRLGISGTIFRQITNLFTHR